MSEWSEDRRYVLESLDRNEKDHDRLFDEVGEIRRDVGAIKEGMAKLTERGTWKTKVLISLTGVLPAIAIASYFIIKALP